jgi:hypothetical protein
MNGYGPSLADQGYSASDVDDLCTERAEQWWRNQTQTGWALPQGRENDFRVSFHIWSGGGKSACGKWAAPLTSFEATPVQGQQCATCERHERTHPDAYAWPDDPRNP